MTRILHAIETSIPGGAETMLISLVERLDKRRYEPVVCLLADGWLDTELRKRGIETAILPQRPGLDWTWIVNFVKLIRRRGIELMHAQEFAMNTCCSIASALTGIPVVTTVQGKNYYPDKRRRRLAYRFVSKQSRMIAVSEDLRRFLIEHVGIRDEQLTTIYNGIDARKYRVDHGERAAIRNELGLDDTQPVIGTAGSLYPVKGHIHLLHAMVIVAKTVPDAVCVIAGRGDLLGQLQTTAAALGIERNVRFLGFRPDVPAVLKALDVFVLPSLSEGFSLALLEALAAGKPVVATRVGGNPEVVADGRNGFLVPREDPKALAEKILLLLGDPALAASFGQRGRMRVDPEFSLTTMVQRYEDLYTACLAN
jgi:glycosyltransferase involved in cell wall biosynthesis